MSNWGTENYKSVRSELTQRAMYVNTSNDLFLIPPSFSVRAAVEAAQAALDSFQSRGSSGKPTPELRPYLFAFTQVSTFDQFTVALDRLIEARTAILGNANVGRISDVLIALWLAGCLAFPREANHLLGRFHGGRVFWGVNRTEPRPEDIISGFSDVSAEKNKYIMSRKLLSVMFSVTGVREVGDLTPSVVDGAFLAMKLSPSITSTIVTMMKDRHGADAINFSSNDYGPFGRQSEKDDEFHDIDKDNCLEEWREKAISWLNLQNSNVRGKRFAIRSFLRYIYNNKNTFGNVEKYLDSSKIPVPSFDESIATTQYVFNIRKFLDWILDTDFVDEDDNGHPYRLPGFRNPVAMPRTSASRLSETVRDAMPTRFVRRLREIIEEDDFAWPKSAFERGVDTFRWKDPETGAWSDLWSPVRAIAVLMKLELPERTFQVRVVNSGEADPERYDAATNTWAVNNHPLAGKTPYGKPMGVAHKLRDGRTGQAFTGLYFNTNKTGDLGKSPEDRGHTIPWHNERILGLASTLREWQERYNPITKATEWKDLHEKAILERYAEQTLADRGAETFLFRDPCSKYPFEPVSHTKLTLFWNKLCAELEDRLAREGETGPGGERIQLVLRTADGRPSGSVYNLHSLRVTMITAWAEVGVPIDIIMKVTAHATAIMTIYYRKLSVSHVTGVLNAASAQMMQSEQENWQAWLRTKSYDDLKSLVAFNDLVGPASFAEGGNSSKMRRDHGICPVGCGLCHEGGQLIEGAHPKKFLPVPGGANNCVRCRFFISGPCFLVGLTAYFDDIQFRLRDASRIYMKSNHNFELLDHQRKLAAKDGRPFTAFAQLEVLSATLDQRTQEVDDLALSWHACYNLIQRSIALLKNPELKSGKIGSPLVTVGDPDDIEYALELDVQGDREFELLNNLCHAGLYFSGINSRQPNLQRMRHFDQLFERNGYDPVFFRMTEEDALVAGNQLGNFIYAKYGTEDATRLMTGRASLRSLGMDAEEAFQQKISETFKIRLPKRSSNKSLPTL